MATNSNSKKGIIIGTIVLLAVLGWRGYNLYKSFSDDSGNSSNNQEHYFGVTTLNTNLVSDFSSVYKNKLAQALDGTITFPNGTTTKNGALTVVNPDGKTTRQATSYVEYVEKNEVKSISDVIVKIKELESTSETKEMINLSLDYFTEAEKIYKTELVKVAKMIDDKAPKEAIIKFAEEEDAKFQPILNAKKEKLFSVAIPYAQKNGLKVNVQNFGK